MSAEYICDKCNGTGRLFESRIQKNNKIWIRCEKCKGTGELNWIENIFGKKYEEGIYYTPYIPLVVHKYPVLKSGDN